MATVNLGIGTNPFPSITDDIQIALFDTTDPLAVVTSQQNSAPHPERTWNFVGLPVANYIFRIFQMIGSSGTVRQQLGGDVTVVPGETPGVAYWEDEQITADTTPGFASGVNTVVFDGTGGKEDWRGRDIATLVRMGGAGTLKKGVDYSWNINTGQLTLLNDGDTFFPGEWFNVTFGVIISPSVASVPAIIPAFLTPKVITADYAVNVGADFGGVIIIRPAGNYLEVTMPALSTVPVNKKIKFEFDPGGMQQCTKIIFQSGEVLSWLQGGRNNLYICNQESIYFYKFIDTDTVSRWRVDGASGNWTHLGEQVVDDNIAANVFNKVLMDGGGVSGLDTKQYARHYNDYVLNLSPAETCNYDDWPTGNNIYLYSLANSADPTKIGKYRIPNRQNTFERTSDGTRTPGNFQPGQLLQHQHNNGVADDKPAGDPDSVFVYGTVTTDMPGASRGQISNGSGGNTHQGLTSNVGGSENRPANIAVRKYILV